MTFNSRGGTPCLSTCSSSWSTSYNFGVTPCLLLLSPFLWPQVLMRIAVVKWAFGDSSVKKAEPYQLEVLIPWVQKAVFFNIFIGV